MKVGVLNLVSSVVTDQVVKGFQEQVRQDLAPREVQFDLQNAQGDQGLVQSIAQNFKRSDDVLFASVGTPANIGLAKVITDRPVIVMAMGDPVGAGLAKSLESPGGNVTGTIDFVDPGRVLDLLAETNPAPSTIGTLYNTSNQNSQVWVKALLDAAKSASVSIKDVTVTKSSDVSSAVRSMSGDVDAFLIGPDTTALAALPAVAAVALQNALPAYVTSGDPKPVGMLASLGPDYTALGATSADIAAKVLAGTDPGTIAFGQPTGLAPEVNPETADKLDVTLPASFE